MVWRRIIRYLSSRIQFKGIKTISNFLVKNIRNQCGMNLIELMVAVAILGIIATIVSTSYTTLRGRAKTREGMALGNAYFTAAKAFAAEYTFYAGNLVAVGFQPEGFLSFRLRADDSDFDPPLVPNDNNCWRTFDACNCGGACPNYKTWVEKPQFPDNNPGDGPGAVEGTGGVTGCVMNGGKIDHTRNTFFIGVSGWISSSATRPFRYMMDHNKRIEICHDGFE